MARTILVADDSTTIRKIVELTFHDSGIRVEAAANGGEALERLQVVQPDLLLADVVMPDPGGYELCERIKCSPRPIPVVLLTGAFEDFDAERAHRCGADDRLVKPFEAQMLRDTVERLLRDSAVPPGAPMPAEEAEELDALSAEVEKSRPPAEDGGSVDELLDEDDPLEQLAVEVDETPRPRAEPRQGGVRLSPEDIEAVADAVVRRLSRDVVRELAREMLPEIATTLVRERIRELEGEDG